MRLRNWSRILLSLASGVALAGSLFAEEFDSPDLPATVVLDGEIGAAPELPALEAVRFGDEDDIQRLSGDYAGIADCGTGAHGYQMIADFADFLISLILG